MVPCAEVIDRGTNLSKNGVRRSHVASSIKFNRIVLDGVTHLADESALDTGVVGAN